MNVYIYNADIYCDDCGLARVAQARLEHRPDNGDSNDFPQGPYRNGGGEADCPQHCADCYKFLQNPLTDDGREYVKHNYRQEWADFYGIEPEHDTREDNVNG